MKKHCIEIYDTTLRDGSQSEEIAYTVEDKLQIAQKLDRLGIHYIEAGWPGANPRDSEFFQRAKKELKLKNAKLVAFGSTRRSGLEADQDPILGQLLESQTPVVCLFGKTWDLHVKEAIRTELSENLEMIRDSMVFFKKKKRMVIFDAEHFFDGYKANPTYALKCLMAATKGGADRLVLCDTNGGSLPWEIEKIVQVVKKKIRTPLGIHCHNDGGVAVANSLYAVRAGVCHVQGTINGIGERCGNANICTIMGDLELKEGYETIGPKKLKLLKDVSRFVDELANRTSDTHQPYVGRSAFAHKGGVHVQAILKNSKTYEHVKPEMVGNVQRLLLSDLSGVATVAAKLKEFGIRLDAKDPQVRTLLNTIKKMENDGYQFEGAEASFELLVKKELGLYKPHFVLHDFQVRDRIGDLPEGTPTSEARVHLSVDGKEERSVAQGVGPVHAIDQAVRKALERFYPRLREIRLVDYKVRVLPAGDGTASKVRVLIECRDENQKWNTLGVSPNIIHASYQALVDAIDYKLMMGIL